MCWDLQLFLSLFLITLFILSVISHYSASFLPFFVPIFTDTDYSGVRAWRVSSVRADQRPLPHLKVSFATDLLIRDFVEPEIANVFLLRTCEINPFSAHDADESSARWLSLGRTYLASAAAAMILES